MPKNINSAYRVRQIINEAKGKPDNIPTHQVWGEVFGINEEDQNKKSFAISRCLADLHDEVESIRVKMSALNYSVNLYSVSLNKCNSILAVQNLSSSWKSMKQKITPEVAVALGFCSEILPGEEELVEPEQLTELNGLVSELRECLSESNLPEYTQKIIRKHLSKIEDALVDYKVVGSKALNEVMQSAYGEVISNEAIFKEAQGTQELSKLSSMWQKTKSILDAVASADKRLGAMQGMAEKGQKVMEFLDNFNV
ncbi:hypothetical protein [Shewanella sp. Isolate11]|uniref:hypothetical protein n=1 Tax=Shewanella sp. Isolate11 TaxID=2908530 RepID=UPI001EFC9FE2|nr:hypothetical protein [Shewanella sp. Isolate11]MCG9697061.1 hypothetical protein [Shewanella sp. Isolate11]